MQSVKAQFVESSPGLQTWPLWLWPQVEQILDQHFADRERPLASGGGKSISYVMMERCRIMGYRSIECPDCFATGVNQDSPHGAGDCPKCQGTCFVSWTEADDCQFAAEVCFRCNGSGRYWRKRHILFAERFALPSKTGAPLIDYRGRVRLSKSVIIRSYVNDVLKDNEHMSWCTLCNGGGRRALLDVVPGEETKSAPAQPDDSAVGNNANASAVLKRLNETQPAVVNVLTLLYGEEGRTAQLGGLGRNFAVWPLTKYGRQIARSGAPGKTPYGRLLAAVKLQAAGEADDLLSARLDLAKGEAARIETRVRQSLFEADQQTRGALLRQAQREALRPGL